MMTKDATQVEINSMSRSSQRTSRPISAKAAEKAWKAKKTAPCKYCGGYHAPRQCPAYGKTCANCHKRNHLSKVCQQGAKSSYKRSKAVNSLSEAADTQIDTDDSDDSLLMDVLSIGTVAVNDDWTEKLSLRPTTINFKLDTGAKANVLPYRSYQRILRTTGGSKAIKKPLTPTKRVLVGIGGGKTRPRGITTIKCTVKSRQIQATNCLSFYVTDENIAVVGSQACQEMNLVKKIGSLKPAHGQKEDPSTSSKEGLINRYHDVFKGLGSYKRSYHIQLKEDAVPVIQPARKYPYAKRQRLEQAIRRLLSQGVIADVEGPTEWVHNVVVTERKNGSLRLCLDPRPLNKAIKREHHAIHTAGDVQAQLAGKKIFTVVDMGDAFWHVKLSEPSSYLCTFSTPWGRKRFLRMPFSLSLASEILQQRNDDTFGDIDNVHVIADDLIIAGKDEQEHDTALLAVMERARVKNVKFSRDKLQYKIKQVKYMGTSLEKMGNNRIRQRWKLSTQCLPQKNAKVCNDYWA